RPVAQNAFRPGYQHGAQPITGNNEKTNYMKTKKIIYWIATGLLALGMTAGGVQQLLQIGGYVEIIASLGYPPYWLPLLGVWKILGVIAVLMPRFPLVKEWAYAGFFFAMSGAATSHFVMGQPFTEAIPALVL